LSNALAAVTSRIVLVTPRLTLKADVSIVGRTLTVCVSMMLLERSHSASPFFSTSLLSLTMSFGAIELRIPTDLYLALKTFLLSAASILDFFSYGSYKALLAIRLSSDIVE
jgi:hypothetical protein